MFGHLTSNPVALSKLVWFIRTRLLPSIYSPVIVPFNSGIWPSPCQFKYTTWAPTVGRHKNISSTHIAVMKNQSVHFHPKCITNKKPSESTNLRQAWHGLSKAAQNSGSRMLSSPPQNEYHQQNCGTNLRVYHTKISLAVYCLKHEVFKCVWIIGVNSMDQGVPDSKHSWAPRWASWAWLAWVCHLY